MYFTFEEECEQTAFDLDVNFEHLNGRTELYLTPFTSLDVRYHLNLLREKGMGINLVTRNETSLVVVVEHRPNLLNSINWN